MYKTIICLFILVIFWSNRASAMEYDSQVTTIKSATGDMIVVIV